MIRAVLVEDVPLARDALRRLLGTHGDVELVGEAASVAEGARLVRRLSPDLLFLDVELPDGTGLDIARGLGAPRPVIVFLTAHPGHALPAFEVEAIDYLLKPGTPEDVARALDRVRRRLGRTPAPALSPRAEHLEIRDGGRTLYVALDQIDRIDAAGHYLCIHVGHDVHLLRASMVELAERLGPAFARVHRSVLVRVDRVIELVDRRNGDGDLRLAGGATVPLSRTYRAELERKLALRRR
jgi:two-component system, LytTR family, response regulator